MIKIVGDGLFPEARVFDDVATALDFDRDIYLAAMMAIPFGIELRDQVIYNLEPLYEGCRSLSIGYMEILKHNKVLDYDRRNIDFLSQHGIEAFHLPYGFHPTLERPVAANKDIDVLFIGSINPRRQQLLAGLEQHCRFVWAQGVYGHALDKLMARAKVHLNVHFCDDHPLEVVRLNYLMANHCTIVSERGWDDAVNDRYADGLIFADNVVEACLNALNAPKDSYSCIINQPHSNTAAQEWLNANTR